jgi:hypothetical protein
MEMTGTWRIKLRISSPPGDCVAIKDGEEILT